MGNLIKITASAAFHRNPIKTENESNYYVNGWSMYDYKTDSAQVLIEKSGKEHLCAICDGMDMKVQDKSTTISAIRELKKFQESAKRSIKGIEVKAEQLCGIVEEVRNLFDSMVLGGTEEKNLVEPAFACLFISENKAFMLNAGNSKIYFIKDGNMRQFPPDSKQTERLLKMGILTNEQAEMLSNRYGISAEQQKSDIKKSDIYDIKKGDTILLCNSGLHEAVEEDRICELLMQEDTDVGHIANTLVREALKNGAQDDVTALVVRIEEEETGYARGVAENRNAVRYYRVRQVDRAHRSSKSVSRAVRRITATFLALIIVIGSIYGLYALWSEIIKGKDTMGRLEPTAVTSGTETAGEETEETEEYPSDDENGEDIDEPDEETETNRPGAAGAIEYKVKAGDSLYQISKKFYNDPEKYRLIMEANNIENPNFIMEGQILIIPDINQAAP